MNYSDFYTFNNAKLLLSTGPHCPPGFQHLGRPSDGRTCFGDNANDDGNGTEISSFKNGSCFSGYDRVRERWTPNTPEEVSRYRDFFP